ncbi:MAG: DUF6276 family protein [Halapricum sp.]
MGCPDCGGETLAFQVPGEFRPLLPGEESGVALCTRCLALHPDPDPPAELPNLQDASDAFPTDPGAAIPMALAVGLLESLALYRSEISELLAAVERAGSDPLLVLDRLARDPDLEPGVDLAGRRRQVEQLL